MGQRSVELLEVSGAVELGVLVELVKEMGRLKLLEVVRLERCGSRGRVLGASVHAKGGKEKGKLDCQVGTRA